MKVYRENELSEIPNFMTEGSACFDVKACLESGKSIVAYNPHNKTMELPIRKSLDGRGFVSLQAGFRFLIPTGLIFDIPKNHVLNLYIRSSIALKYGLMLANGVAVIDSDFVDPTYLLVINTSDTPYTLYHGDRIAQGELREIKTYTLTERKTPPSKKTDREGGIGSTGTN
jgi:dUTP pyrophosphatase